MSAQNEILIILALTLVNGILAMSETAIISVSKTRLQNLVKKGDKKAKLALDLANHPNKFLSATQFGITLIGIFAGAYSGVTLADSLEGVLNYYGYFGSYGKEVSFIIVVVSITYLNLIIGELVPKRIALNNPVKLSRYAATIMKTLSIIGMPFVYFLSRSTDLIIKLIRLKPSKEPTITEDEIKVLIEHGTREGVFESSEKNMVEGVLSLSDYKINVLMTPRTKIAWLDINESVDEIFSTIYETKYSRFPLCDGSLDNVLGIIRVKDILPLDRITSAQELKQFLIQPVYVAESAKALKLLELFKATKKHIAFIVDEYGSLVGLLTLNDIVEAIVGEIPAYGREEDPSIVKREDGSYLLDGMLAISDFKELFQISFLPDEERKDYDTLAGFIMKRLGRIPSTGEHFIWDTYYFEVVDMDGRRIDKVLTKQLK
jgi:putative hemolysin